MEKDRSIQEHIEQERLQLKNPEKGFLGFLIGLLFFFALWYIMFFILCYITQMPIKESETDSISNLIDLLIYGTIESFFKYLIIPGLSFILSLAITLYLFDKLSTTFEKFKPKIEPKIIHEDLLDVD